MRLIKTIVYLLLTMCLLSGCAATSSQDSTFAVNSLTEDYYDYDYDYEVDSVSLSGTSGYESRAVVASDEKLVYNCSLTIESLEYRDAKETLYERVAEFGGLIEQESETDSDYAWYYTDHEKKSATLQSNITVRIPSESYYDFLESVDGIGKVTRKSSTIDNITKSYNDVSTTLESLRIQEQRLLDMYDEALTIEDMIAVESRLTQVQSQLAMYSNQLIGMDADVAYATVYIQLNEVMEYTVEPEETPGFFSRLGTAILTSLAMFITCIQSVILFIIYAFPFVVVYGALIYIVVRIVKFFVNRKDKKEGGDSHVSVEENGTIQ